MQVDPIKPALKAPGTKRLKLKYYKLLSTFGFNFNLRRYTKAGNEGLMSGAVARDAGGGGGGGPSGGGGGVLGEEFLAKSPPWDCSCCKVKCTSVETLMGHASGKKHKSKSRSALAAMGRGPDGAPLPPPKEEPKVGPGRCWQ